MDSEPSQTRNPQISGNNVIYSERHSSDTVSSMFSRMVGTLAARIPQGFQDILRQSEVFPSVYGSGSRNSGHETSGYAKADDSPGFPEIDAIICTSRDHQLITVAHYCIIHPHIA